jgi:hypothetical protein
MGKHDISNKDKVFRDSIGQKATVHRETVGTEKAAIPNRMLCDLGLSMPEADPQLKNYKYMGSAAVHIYVNEIMNHMAFVSQANPLVLYRCPEDLASKAMEDLIREVKAAFGRKHGRLRSGF